MFSIDSSCVSFPSPHSSLLHPSPLLSSSSSFPSSPLTCHYRWLEPLLELIEKVNARFSSYFSLHTHLNCAGLVRLEPNPEENPDFSDFEKYGVQIKVKFRDQEEMQELNAQRQSGGERSVATVLYLMALQVCGWGQGGAE